MDQLAAVGGFVAIVAVAIVVVLIVIGVIVTNAETADMRRRIKYRCEDGRTDYSFEFATLTDGTWRVYILVGPPYGSRDTSLHATHRLIDNRRYYICWTDPLRSEQQARQVAKLWAEKTQQYIRTGNRF